MRGIGVHYLHDYLLHTTWWRGPWVRWMAVFIIGSMLVTGPALVLLSEPWYDRVLGATTTLGAPAAAFCLKRSHKSPGPADQLDGGVGLSLRVGYHAVLGSALLLAGVGLFLFGAGSAMSDDPHSDAAYLATTSPVLVWLGGQVLVRTWNGRGQIRLDPEGIHYGSLTTRPRSLRWKEIDTVELEPVFRLRIVLRTHRGYRQPHLDLPLAGQTWPGETVAEIVQWYVDHRDDRAELTDAAVLDRWRTTDTGDHRSS